MGTQKILIKKSTVAGKVPVAADLDVGELAVNTADPALYTKHSDGTIKKLIQSGQEISGILKLIYNDETDSSEYASSTSESGVLKTFTLPANQYSKIIIEFIASSRVEQDATTKCDFTYRVKSAGNTVRSFINRITANSSTGADSGDRITSTLSHIMDGGQTTETDITITVQHTLSNANTATTIKAFRVYGLVTGAMMKGEPGSIEANSDVIFSEAATKVTINSGDSIGVLFGKIKKWFSSFGALAWKSSVDFSSEVASKPSTIAGYGILNAYTKTEVDAKIPNNSLYYSGFSDIDIGYIVSLGYNYHRLVPNTSSVSISANTDFEGKTAFVHIHNSMINSVVTLYIYGIEFVSEVVTLNINESITLIVIGKQSSGAKGVLLGKIIYS